MSDLAIEASGIGKRYVLGQRQTYVSLRETIVNAMRAPARFIGRVRGEHKPQTKETFWALKDVSFRIEPGEVVGIIGRNGAGKSTLLKLLSRITEPTEGRITMRGRVSSLLEVGTGFHPELTGRENIFLNGAILGMRRREILRRFDEIVAFAEVEKFIDTPVKHYSSGMYMRLAFSVAAHLEPDILLVDEVLAVGDSAFQRKCLNKMESVGKGGRTVFFVSHSMQSITRLCPRAIMLEGGEVRNDGPSPQVVSAYLRSGLGSTAARTWPDGVRAPGNNVVRLRAIRVRAGDEVQDSVDIRSGVSIEMDYEVLVGGTVLVPNLHFFDEQGTCLFVTQELVPEWRRKPRPAGLYRSVATVPGNFFAEGGVVVAVAISTTDPVTIHLFEPDAVAFQVVERSAGDTARGDYVGNLPGVVRPLLDWTTTEVERAAQG